MHILVILLKSTLIVSEDRAGWLGWVVGLGGWAGWLGRVVGQVGWAGWLGRVVGLGGWTGNVSEFQHSI